MTSFKSSILIFLISSVPNRSLSILISSYYFYSVIATRCPWSSLILSLSVDALLRSCSTKALWNSTILKIPSISCYGRSFLLSLFFSWLYLSAPYAIRISKKKKSSVSAPSSIFIIPGVQISRQTYIQTYAKTLEIVVTMKTPTSSIFFIDPVGTAIIDTPEIMSKLNAALPTIVEGPSSPGFYPNFNNVSITESRISGAEEPSAMRVRLATVGFQIWVVIVLYSPLS